MRENDFSSIIKEQSLKRAQFRCERCWAEKDLECHHILSHELGGQSTIDNCVVLCHHCHGIAPQDSFLLKNLFLRFSSSKELINFYHVRTEQEAIQLFCTELRIDFQKTLDKIRNDPCSHLYTILNGMEERVKQKGHAGFNIPYGYIYEKGKLDVYPDEAQIVKEIFQWYLEGKSLGDICEILNNAHIRSKKGGMWAKKCISSILKNPLYCGYHRWMNYLVRADHEKIINPVMYNQVQKMLMLRNGMQPLILPLH